ncbi:UNVERIFIED_CONTAM: hypothetical protein GTU68_001648 [Idotea baltica]|nr:hypothetical protein [Idotea baltica]
MSPIRAAPTVITSRRFSPTSPGFLPAQSDVSRSAAVQRAVDLLEEIGIKDAAARIKAYPHQFSGGMRQRVVIALAICTDPELIIADEPTTALDVAVQSQVLDLIRRLAKDRQIAFMLITHDIGVIAQIADRVTVMRNGRVMETGDTEQVLSRPSHPYTRALMDAVPPLDHRITRFRVPDEAETTTPGTERDNAAERWLLDGLQHEFLGLTLDNIYLSFPGTRTSLWHKPDPYLALQDINLTIRPGSIMGLVGESGSGKSTLAKAITGLIAPTSGDMILGGRVLPAGKAPSAKDRLAMLNPDGAFQDPIPA